MSYSLAFFLGDFIELLTHPSDSDTSADTPEGSLQDILTCGSCQKTFALSDIVRFIQHKVNQCNKENYGQCFSQGESIKIDLGFSYFSFCGIEEKLLLAGGTPSDRDADDGRPLSLVNTRRPSISAPISARKPSGSRVHSPPLSSPAELLLLGDGGSSSTPKRLSDGKWPDPLKCLRINFNRERFLFHKFEVAFLCFPALLFNEEVLSCFFFTILLLRNKTANSCENV